MRPLLSCSFVLVALTLSVAIPSRAHAMDHIIMPIDDGSNDWGDGDGDWSGGRSSDWSELPDDIRESLQDMWDNWDEWMEFVHRPTELSPEPATDPTKESDPSWERPGRCEDYDASRDWWVYQNWGCG